MVQELNDRKKELEDMDTTLRARDAAIRDKEAVLRDKEAAIRDKEAAIRDKETAVQVSLVERDGQLECNGPVIGIVSSIAGSADNCQASEAEVRNQAAALEQQAASRAVVPLAEPQGATLDAQLAAKSQELSAHVSTLGVTTSLGRLTIVYELPFNT